MDSSIQEVDESIHRNLLAGIGQIPSSEISHFTSHIHWTKQVIYINIYIYIYIYLFIILIIRM